MASRSSGSPAAGVYLWFFGSRAAAAAASTMCSGVGKSGSPAAKLTTGLPSAFSCLAFASTLSVADSVMEPMRVLILATRPAYAFGRTGPRTRRSRDRHV
jgi:hypothetical protein